MSATAVDFSRPSGAIRLMVDRAFKDSRAAPASPCVAVEAVDGTFTLYPPTPFAIEERAPRYKLLLPFGRAAVDVALGNGSCLRRQLRPGDLIVAQPGSRILMRHVEPLEFLLVLLNPDAVRKAAEAAAGDAWRIEDSAPWNDPAVVSLGQEMRRTMIADPLPCPGYLVALASALVARLAVATGGEITKAQRDLIAPAVLARVVRHIEARLAYPIEVAELAGVAGLSQAHFARVFARSTGDTPHRFVMKRRVCRARDMLSSGDATLAEVAVRSGFANQAHMSTAFAREVGLSPARYRAAFRSDDPTAISGGNIA